MKCITVDSSRMWIFAFSSFRALKKGPSRSAVSTSFRALRRASYVATSKFTSSTRIVRRAVSTPFVQAMVRENE